MLPTQSPLQALGRATDFPLSPPPSPISRPQDEPCTNSDHDSTQQALRPHAHLMVLKGQGQPSHRVRLWHPLNDFGASTLHGISRRHSSHCLRLEKHHRHTHTARQTSAQQKLRSLFHALHCPQPVTLEDNPHKCSHPRHAAVIAAARRSGEIVGREKTLGS